MISRPLSAEENFFRCRTHIDWYRNFGSVAAYSRDLNDWPLLFRALRKSILEYHVLICNVFENKEGGFMEMRPIKSATFGDLVEFSEDLFSPKGEPVPEWFLHKLCRTLYFSLYVEKPLFKIIILGNRDLAFTNEHTLSDGVVALYFQEIFLHNIAYCDDPANKDEYLSRYGSVPDQVDLDTVVFDLSKDKHYIKHSLPPPIDMFMDDPSLDYTDGDENHYSKRVPASHPERWPGRFPVTLDFEVAYKLINIPPAELKALLKVCKEHKVSLTSYLTTNLVNTLQPLFKPTQHITCSVAMTLRRFLTPEKVTPEYHDIFEPNYKLMGNFAHMGVPQSFAPVVDFSWLDAEEFQNDMLSSVKNTKLLNLRKPLYDKLLPLGDSKELFECALGAPKGDAFKVSNIGAANFPVFETQSPLGPWTINDIVFSQDMAPHAADFIMNLVSSPRGGLNIVISYFNHSFEDAKKKFFDDLPAKLKENILNNVGLPN